MPLLNSIIERLNEITTTIQDKNKLSTDDEVIIKQIFNSFLRSLPFLMH